jgi:hypothetical protein
MRTVRLHRQLFRDCCLNKNSHSLGSLPFSFWWSRLCVISNTSKNKGQGFIECPPRTRGQGGPHGLSAPPSPQRVKPARNPGRRNCIFLHLFEVIQLQMDLSEAIKDYINAFLRGAASRPCGPPALWLGRRSRPGWLG